jgi:GNAT superfamily N-acetyltransferase
MIIIRRASRKDTPSIIEFQQKMAWETEEMNLIPEIISKGVSGVFEDPSRGQYYVWWFQSVYVLPEFRRTGIFRKMYTFIKEEADKNKVAGLRLYVESNNIRARKTYEALGMSSEHYTMYEWLRE